MDSVRTSLYSTRHSGFPHSDGANPRSAGAQAAMQQKAGQLLQAVSVFKRADAAQPRADALGRGAPVLRPRLA